jgi:hypothetical protein
MERSAATSQSKESYIMTSFSDRSHPPFIYNSGKKSVEKEHLEGMNISTKQEPLLPKQR